MYLNVASVDMAVQTLASTFPSLSSLVTLPFNTVETRTSHALRIGAGPAGTKAVFMIVGGHHAREWGSCEILLNLATDLLNAYTKNAGLGYGGQSYSASQIKTLLDTLDLVIFPMVNPDGRNFSMVSDALWRKNRNPAYLAGSNDPLRVGVDINRNYDFLFDFKTAFGTQPVVSDDTISEVYLGPSAFSERESQNVRWLLDSYPTTRWFVDVHSFSNDILFSWGDDNDQSTDPAMNFMNSAYDHQRGILNGAYGEYIQADDLALIQRLGNKYASSLQPVRGKAYTVKSSYDLYPTSGCSDDYAFSRFREDPSKGKVYSFVIEWGDPPVDGSQGAEIKAFQPDWSEMQNIIMDVSSGLIGMCIAAPCGDGLTPVSVNTPVINFIDVPAQVTTSRAAVISVETCAAVNLNIVSGPTVTSGPGSFSAPLGNVALGTAPNDSERLAYLWVSFTGTNPGAVTHGTMSIQCVQTGETFTIGINANTIAQPAVGSMLVLDQSGSMDFQSGVPNMKRIDVLHAAAPTFVNLLPDVDGAGVVAFDQDAYLRQNVQAGAVGRAAADAAIANHQTNAQGSTSIGDGVELAHNTLAGAGGFTDKAVVVFTDGEENTSKFIKDVMSSIDNRVFAIGLGTVQQVNPVALNQLVNNTGGYLLLTDQLGPNDQLRLPKYFVQIAAGVTNTEVVVDPQGVLQPGVTVKIPFWINEGDYGADAIVLSTAPWAFDFLLETPDGVVIDHTHLGAVLDVSFQTFSQMSFYRLSFPVVAKGAAAQVGRWNILLKINLKSWRKYLSTSRKTGDTQVGVPYSAMVHARSSVSMRAFLTQASYVSGATMHLRAVITEIGMPAQGPVSVTAEIKRPDGTQANLALSMSSPGVFEGDSVLSINGIYPVRFLAVGKTVRGSPYTREQLRNGMAWAGGDDPLPTGPATGGDWCGLLNCLLADKGILRWLKESGIDAKQLERCIEKNICGGDKRRLR